MNKGKFRVVIGILITIGFFGTLFYLFKNTGPNFDPKDVLLILVGALAAKFSTVTDFLFGSSQGSEQKTDLLSK